jgi:hypothetical protein
MGEIVPRLSHIFIELILPGFIFKKGMRPAIGPTKW